MLWIQVSKIRNKLADSHPSLISSIKVCLSFNFNMLSLPGSGFVWEGLADLASNKAQCRFSEDPDALCGPHH